MPFNFEDVVLAEGAIKSREDRDWCLVIGCGAQSSIDHGTDTQNPLGRHDPHDVQGGIRTSDDLLALQEVLAQLSIQVAQKLDDLGLGEPV